jgi:eukaryotic-like serine/threonine-protein kinase
MVERLCLHSISSLGKQYVITLSAINAQTGDSIAQVQTQADEKEKVLNALTGAVSDLRQKLGESLGSIQKFGVPIEQATTPSLGALKAYSLGVSTRRAGQDERAAIPFFQRAIELDPDFAIAYNALAIVYIDSGEPERAVEYQQKALKLIDRVSEIEKFRILELYHFNVTRDLDKDAELVQLWAHTYPDDRVPGDILAQIYATLGKFEQALTVLRGLPGSTDNKFNYNHLAAAHLGLGRLSEAKNFYNQAVEKNVDDIYTHYNRFLVAWAEGDPTSAERESQWLKDKPGGHFVTAYESRTCYCQGRVREGRTKYRQAQIEAQGQPEIVGWMLADQAVWEALIGELSEAQVEASRALEISRARDVLSGTAVALALAGEKKRSESIIAGLVKVYPKDTLLIKLIRASRQGRGRAIST